ncbi:DNA-3-methyladenine glycosylase family protein [Spirosoma spitsbergense]|uniref:DNA-3-methyladenine glycosylase family protein n=1 Tax=Spirosoma spitsbergense TaxID=431554 RepID=UPI00036F4203|nr:DNA-3-methyladenine glycosylase [Spirosoma spitsbergense]
MHPTNSAPLLHLAKDPVMARLIAETPAPKAINVSGDTSTANTPVRDRVYLALLESIVSQQISVKAADAIFTRFCALFPDNYPQADALLLKTTEELRSAGLSFQKIKYLQSVAEFSLNKSDEAHEGAALDRAKLDPMTDEEIVQYLLPIKGVGRWTVEMLLMFVLDRPDVFPIDDLVIRQRMILAYPEQTNGLTGKALYRVLQEIADPWRPYRTTACRYLWRWKPAAQ